MKPKPVSVVCPPDQRLHLALNQKGLGVCVFTLCLQKWKHREPCRADSEFCPECLRKFEAMQEKAA